MRPAGYFCAALIAAWSPIAAAEAQTRAPIAYTGDSVDALRPLPASVWFADGRGEATAALIDLIASGAIDGVEPDLGRLDRLRQIARNAADRPDTQAAADALLTRALIDHVAAMRAVAASAEWTVVDRSATRVEIAVEPMLRAAAEEGRVAGFIAEMPWMHDSYAGLRGALVAALRDGDPADAARLRLNLDRARLLPGRTPQRYVLVNAAAQKLYMYEDGRAVDSMRVVVGKASQPTPMMAAMIRFTAVNPYWNLPSDLVAERVAPNVVRDGLKYLSDKGYVVLSDWSERPTVIDPATIDWHAVLAGTTAIRVRQEPGPANAMGEMKFMFPNDLGVYLHDTPNKELLVEPQRLMSAGCVRLEDAPRLARWLYGHDLMVTPGMAPEQRVDLPAPVPVYLAYLTAVPEAGEMKYYSDIYHRDTPRLAEVRAQ